MLLLIELPFCTFLALQLYIFKALLVASKCDIFILHMFFFKLYIRCFSYFISISACNTCAIVTVFIKGNLT